MKKIIALTLSLMVLLSLLGCGANTETPPETTRSPYYDENMPGKLLSSTLENFPKATEDMSKEQLRQLCLDFFRFQLTFQWAPKNTVNGYTSYNFGYPKPLDATYVYEGIPYWGTASGNPYRWMEYYDEVTGTMDLDRAFAENGGLGEGAATDGMGKNASGLPVIVRYRSFMSMFNQCSSSAGWAWSRAVNSVRFGMTSVTNVYHGYIPVGCYTYGFENNGVYYGPTQIQVFGTKNAARGNPIGYDTKHVIRDLKAEKGDEALFDCYTQMKPADCLVSGGHILMVQSVNLFKNEAGDIDYKLSTVTVLEQVDSWGHTGLLNGKPLYRQGKIDQIYTFAQLQEEYYIPFTFAEFLDENDPQDKKHLDYYNSYVQELEVIKNCYNAIDYTPDMMGSGIEKAEVYSTLDKRDGSITCDELKAMSVGSNYSVSDVFVIVTDAQGNELLRNIHRCGTSHIREVAMSAGVTTWEEDANGNVLPISHGIEEFADGTNTVKISLQLSTGDVFTAFEGILTK